MDGPVFAAVPCTASFTGDCNRAEIQRERNGRKLTLYGCRKFFNTYLAAEGVSHTVRQRLMRHADGSKLTDGTYLDGSLDPLQAAKRQAVCSLPPVVGGRPVDRQGTTPKKSENRDRMLGSGWTRADENGSLKSPSETQMQAVSEFSGRTLSDDFRRGEGRQEARAGQDAPLAAGINGHNSQHGGSDGGTRTRAAGACKGPGRPVSPAESVARVVAALAYGAVKAALEGDAMQRADDTQILSEAELARVARVEREHAEKVLTKHQPETFDPEPFDEATGPMAPQTGGAS